MGALSTFRERAGGHLIQTPPPPVPHASAATGVTFIFWGVKERIVTFMAAIKKLVYGEWGSIFIIKFIF